MISDRMSYGTEEEKKCVAEGLEEPVELVDVLQHICQAVGARFSKRNTTVFCRY